MKKVRAVLGAAGLAPAALALGGGHAVAVTAHANAAGRASTKSVKTLYHRGPGPGVSRSHCTGTESTNTPSSNGYQVFWWKSQSRQTCIGTIKRYFSNGIGSTTKIRYRIWSGNTSVDTHSQVLHSGPPGTHNSFAVRTWFPGTNYHVCTAIYNDFHSKWSDILCGDADII
jgi:hypothetical protein